MRLLLAALTVCLVISCNKTGIETPRQTITPDNAIPEPLPEFPAYHGPNPIAGKWLVGKYARWCGTDSTVFENNNGNYIEFSNNDTAYNTYVTDGSSGYGPYAIIDAETVWVYGEVYKIISIDEHHFTLYYEQQDGWIRQWLTFLQFREEMK